VDRFVEPFAGGASVALQLAAEGTVRKIILADVDELVYSFWHTAAFDTDWLIAAMWDVEITVAQWERFRESEPGSIRDRALKCLFLNRTSYSGILHRRAGPIGGKLQKSENPIGCRFSKETLHNRIAKVGQLARQGRLEDVLHADWKATAETVRRLVRNRVRGVLFYFDPPFYAKAKNLYRYSFRADDHILLANFLRSFRYPWVLSYDDHPEVHALYEHHEARGKRLFLHSAEYRAASASRRATELIVTNLSRVVDPQEAK
jgi:DNA adenine methylase